MSLAEMERLILIDAPRSVTPIPVLDENDGPAATYPKPALLLWEEASGREGLESICEIFSNAL